MIPIVKLLNKNYINIEDYLNLVERLLYETSYSYKEIIAIAKDLSYWKGDQKYMRHYSFRLGKVEYFNYIVDDRNYYLKVKGFVNDSDGMYEYQIITKQTYLRNIKKGFKENIVNLNTINPLEIEIHPVAKVLAKHKKVNELSLRTGLFLAQEDLKAIRKKKSLDKEYEKEIFIELVKKYFLEEQARRRQKNLC